MEQNDIKEQVRQFYDQVGWKTVSDGIYQNARYEDLREVSRDYIHKCHLRVNRHLKPSGKYLLDAGSGPVQYPEYLTYSKNYEKRICVDISILALKEARKRIGEKGLYVVADVAHLPFKDEVFDGAVSLHTFHHLALKDQKQSYQEIYRSLLPNSTGVIVNGWTFSPMMNRQKWLIHFMEWLGRRVARLRGISIESEKINNSRKEKQVKDQVGTYIEKLDYDWVKKEVMPDMKIDVKVWRSVNVRFLRAVIHKPYGKLLLRFLFWLEELAPLYFGTRGQYPLIIMYKD